MLIIFSLVLFFFFFWNRERERERGSNIKKNTKLYARLAYHRVEMREISIFNYNNIDRNWMFALKHKRTKISFQYRQNNKKKKKKKPNEILHYRNPSRMIYLRQKMKREREKKLEENGINLI